METLVLQESVQSPFVAIQAGDRHILLEATNSTSSRFAKTAAGGTWIQADLEMRIFAVHSLQCLQQGQL